MRNFLRVGFIVLLVELIIIAIVWNRLPDQIAIHFDINGDVDLHGSKFAVFYIPIFLVVLNAVLYGLKKIFSTNHDFMRSVKYYDITISVQNIILFIVFLLIIHYSIYSNSKTLMSVVIAMVGVVFIIIGNYMPKIKQNGLNGIKTPWTMKSERVWFKTHRVAGFSFVGLGFIWIICSLFTSSYILIVLITLTIFLALFLTLYSYTIYKK